MMKKAFPAGETIWRHAVTGVDGNTTLFGVNIFRYEWVPTGEQVTVQDPSYRQEYRFSVYTADIGGQSRVFAAGEFSCCVWGFYLPVTPQAGPPDGGL